MNIAQNIHGSYVPNKLSQTDVDHYSVLFNSILVERQQLKLEPRLVAEGDSNQMLYAIFDLHCLIGAFGIVQGGTLERGWDHEAVTVTTVTGEFMT